MHVQSCYFAYKSYCFLTFSLPSASLDLIGTLSEYNDDGSETVGKKNEFAFFQT